MKLKKLLGNSKLGVIIIIDKIQIIIKILSNRFPGNLM